MQRISKPNPDGDAHHISYQFSTSPIRHSSSIPHASETDGLKQTVWNQQKGPVKRKEAATNFKQCTRAANRIGWSTGVIFSIQSSSLSIKRVGEAGGAGNLDKVGLALAGPFEVHDSEVKRGLKTLSIRMGEER